MDACRWCGNDKVSATTCSVSTLHICGEPIRMIPFGDERWWSVIGAVRCHGCGVGYGGLHHPGCDLQACPLCLDPLMSCRCRFDEIEICYCPACWGGDEWPREPMGVDANGCPTELMNIGGSDVIVHYDDIPESDITTVGGIRCTTALRTAIDIAPGDERRRHEPDHRRLSQPWAVHPQRSVGAPCRTRHGRSPRRGASPSPAPSGGVGDRRWCGVVRVLGGSVISRPAIASSPWASRFHDRDRWTGDRSGSSPFARASTAHAEAALHGVQLLAGDDRLPAGPQCR